MHIQARRTVNNLIRDADLSTEAFSHIDIIYGVWENEDIVETERWRNIGIVFAFVFVSTRAAWTWILGFGFAVI